ncbi:MAG: ABC transporter ATP-binding protein [Cutibacterium granulosum]|jgi:hypothetical protein|uniref:ABC transporter ATP-binding protein n=1 Tax=Cutibacterium TaxID=1912216 RepID=UPI00290C6997|nr:ABC transporter ATP-binding protein [Cutibacterium granulosum]MBS5254292.1 ABC transporter ATP-binding protein [Cutibacterium granulosum]MDU3821196.1 ABC transporter ATP-binding protein [Cutibacterium granulosum]MEA5665428.1 ABC transporter ATP-binding protein [Cutibacterium granulosum]
MILCARHLSLYYTRGREVLKDVSFTLDSGQILSILGPNGAGKSTLLKCLTNELRPTHGTVLLKDAPLDDIGTRNLAKHLAYVPQTPDISYSFPVIDYVVMGRTPYLSRISSPTDCDYELARQSLCKLGIEHLEQSKVTAISGGELQLVCIARALTQNPDVILFDEPTSHLDFANAARTLRIIKELSDAQLAIIMTTHDPNQVLTLEGRVGLLSRVGEFTVGSTQETVNSHAMTTLYGEPVNVVWSSDLNRRFCAVR